MNRPASLRVAGGKRVTSPCSGLHRAVRLANELRAELERLASEIEQDVRVLPAKWAAYEFGVSPKTMIRWAAASGCGRRVGGRWLIDTGSLARWLDARPRRAR